MKKSIILLCLLSITYTLSFAQIPTDGLVGYWPFNGNANDESGNGNHGVVNGAVLTDDRHGSPNSAYEFDGSDKIDLGDHLDGLLHESILTISFWFRVNNTGWRTIIGNLKHGGQGWIIYINSTGIIKYVVYGGGNYGDFFSTSTANIEQNKWHHAVLLFRGLNDYDIYFDGEKMILDENDPLDMVSGSLDTNSTAIGYAWVYYFSGKIDDISIYDRVLSETEIQSLYIGEALPPPDLCQNVFCDGSNIGIGTPDTYGYRLAVAGKIITEEIKVATQPNWPDYVFEDNYQRPKLLELEKYILANKRLPNIPDAQSVLTEGYNLSELDARILEKIEELTLYIIEQNKKIETLKKKLNNLNEKMIK